MTCKGMASLPLYAIPDVAYPSRRTSFVCHPGLRFSATPHFAFLSRRTSLFCHPGLDPGSMTCNGRLQCASLHDGSRVFAQDDKKFRPGLQKISPRITKTLPRKAKKLRPE
jgi:hypothetical protein